MKQKLIYGALVIVIAIIALSVIGMFVFDGIAQSLIQTEGSKGLGVKVTLDSAHVGFFKKDSNLRGLTIANPTEFLSEETPNLLSVQAVDMEFGLTSLMGETIEIPTASVSGVILNLEQIDGMSNIATLIDNIAKDDSPKTTEDETKPFNIGTLTISDITVVARGSFTVIDSGPVTAHIKEIVLHNLGTDGNAEVAIETITTAITSAIMQHLADHPIEGFSKLAISQVTGLFDQLPAIGELGIGETIQGVTDEIGKGVDDLLQGVGGLLGGGDE